VKGIQQQIISEASKTFDVRDLDTHVDMS